MSRKLVTIVVLAVLVVTVPVALYFHFRSNSVEGITNTAYANSLYTETTTYESFLVECLEDNEAVVLEYHSVKGLEDINVDTSKAKLAYFTSNDTDSEYVERALLVPLSLEGENPLPEIIKVSTDETKNLTVTQLKNNFSIETTPALVYYQVENGNVQVISTLVYRADAPFTKDELRTWFFDNGLWNGPYNE
ncbi:MAG: hypothetical protein GX753_05010 [Erysipelothrix sp.]|nr:hypothetical protein [Erysipelothrix sp.]